MQILSLQIAAFHFPGGFDFDRTSSLVHCEKKGYNTTVRSSEYPMDFLNNNLIFQRSAKKNKYSNFSFLRH